MSVYEELERDRVAARQAGLQAERARADLLSLRSDLAALRMQLALTKLRHALRRKYRPDQPRVPAGNPHGGQWTDEGGGQGTSGGETVDVDVTGSTESPPGFFHRGRHHYVPQSVYKSMNFPTATRKVFDEGTTAPLNAGPHGWSREHAVYNEAVKEHLQRFMSERAIRAEAMTPDQAREFVDRVKHSTDPRIRGFNLRIFRRQFLYWLRRSPRSD